MIAWIREHLRRHCVVSKIALVSISTLIAVFTLVSCNGSGGGSEEAGGGGAPPTLTNVDPAANASSALSGSAITATFDQNMDPAAAGTFVAFGSQTGKLAGTYTGGGSDALQFDPGSGFKPGEVSSQPTIPEMA